MSRVVALLALMLAGCGDDTDGQVCSRWNRVVAGSARVPTGVIDRVRFCNTGSVVREVDGTTTNGEWEQFDITLVLIYPHSTWTGTATRTRICPDAPGSCLILAGEGVHDVYQAY